MTRYNSDRFLIAKNHKLSSILNGGKSAALQFFHKLIQSRISFNVADFAPYNTTFSRGLGAKDMGDSVIWREFDEHDHTEWYRR